jgi:hypothetical protein
MGNDPTSKQKEHRYRGGWDNAKGNEKKTSKQQQKMRPKTYKKNKKKKTNKTNKQRTYSCEYQNDRANSKHVCTRGPSAC